MTVDRAPGLRRVVPLTQTWNKSGPEEKGPSRTQINQWSVITFNTILHKSICIGFDLFPYGTFFSFIHPHICLCNEYWITRLLDARRCALRWNHRDEKDTVTHSGSSFILVANYLAKTNLFLNEGNLLTLGRAPSERMKGPLLPGSHLVKETATAHGPGAAASGDIIQWILLQVITGKRWYNLTMNECLECGGET